MVSREDLQKKPMFRKGDAGRDDEARQKLKFELHDAKLKLEMIEDCKERVTDADQKATAATL